jgi:hypothetical protein
MEAIRSGPPLMDAHRVLLGPLGPDAGAWGDLTETQLRALKMKPGVLAGHRPAGRDEPDSRRIAGLLRNS